MAEMMMTLRTRNTTATTTPPPAKDTTIIDDNDDAYSPHEYQDHEHQEQKPLPPKFRRRSTIRDSVDLAYSIEEFVRNLNNNNNNNNTNEIGYDDEDNRDGNECL